MNDTQGSKDNPHRAVLRTRPRIGYCSRCNQTMPLYERKVIYRAAGWIELQSVCGFCNWVCMIDCRRMDGGDG